MLESTRYRLLAAVWVATAGIVCLAGESAAAHSRHDSVGIEASDLQDLDWTWPAERFELRRPFAQPAHAYGPGHRGVDLDLLDGSRVRSPADGVIAFAGEVAGRPVVTIDHGDDLVSTLEPVRTELSPGALVRRAEDIGTLGTGGHSSPGSLHFGVRLSGEYINPLLLLGGLTRAILLPCCE